VSFLVFPHPQSSLLTHHLACSKLKRIAATGDHIELNAFELLDLDSMEED
jgi:hypothetical protein